MNALRPISKEHHTNKRWQRYSDYSFAATNMIVPLAAAELAHAVRVFPMAFIEIKGQWSLVAVLGLTPGRNLFVAPNGRWIGSYVPAALRSYPFQLVQTQVGEAALCVDEASGLVTDGGQGNAFFDEAGGPSEPTKEVLDFLMQTARSRKAVEAACAVLAQQGVIEPWPIRLMGKEQERAIQGLGRINEAALNSLPEEGFLSLRRAGALPVAYGQLLSLSNITSLGKLAQAHAQVEAQGQASTQQPIDLDQTFGLSNGETVDWTSMKWDE
jgi:hypothetical protein